MESTSRLLLIPRAVLFGNPQNTDPAISPDGHWLAWIGPDDGVLNIWIRDLSAGSKTDRVISHDRGRGITQFCWSPDGTRLLYLQDDDGDENWRLRDVRLDNGIVRDLTPHGTQATLAKVSLDHPDRILIGLNLDDQSMHDIYSLDMESGRTRLVYKNHGYVQLTADENLCIRAAVQMTADGGASVLVRPDGQADWRPILTVDHEDAQTIKIVGFDRDGSHLFCITSADAPTTRLIKLRVTDGERTLIAGHDKYDVAGVDIDQKSREPRIVFVVGDRLTSIVLDSSIRDFEKLGELNREVRLLGGDREDRRWVVSFATDVGPLRYHLYERDTGKVSLLFSQRPALEGHSFAHMEPFIVSSRDGLDLHGYITSPANLPRKKLPAVLLVHGGPWARDIWGFNPTAQWLTDRGYLVVQVNFRGSTGYGKQFMNAGNREWGGRMHDDLLDVLAWTVANGWVDQKRVGVFGGSYGGYAALASLTFTPEVFACGVALCAPSNLSSLIRAIPPYWKPMIADLHLRVGDPEHDSEFLAERSPLYHTDAIRAPLLIGQGANDPRVPRSEADQIVAELHRSGIPHQYLLYPDEGHGLVKPDNRLDFFAASEAFLARHLGGRTEDAQYVSPFEVRNPSGT